MTSAITRIELGSGVFSVNAYLIRTDLGFVLVDTGTRGQRAKIEQHLAAEGCDAGSLKLIVITHGDADHIGNAAHLRRALGAPIAMNAGDIGMTRDSDMFSGRSRPGWLARTFLPLFARVREQDRFEPDVLLDERSDLSEYGLAATRVLLLRGHSSGSIGVLLRDGTLFCGDVLENRSTPKLGSIMDDAQVARESVQRLGAMPVGVVYPGHGRPFRFSELGV